ncbi:MAG: transporter substrate-binding domain-containing protein, partial [Cyclobacteriaceae bacterium]|nr:transporter substrate-binding domain-containing protein [Cyclobacteriaceae bacterium]
MYAPQRYKPCLLPVICLFLTLCTSPGKEPEKESLIPSVHFDLDQIRERGRLIAIVDNSSTSYFHYRGQPMGYEYDLLKRYCQHIGVELELNITHHIDSAFDRLHKGEGDIMAYFLTITKERREKVAFAKSLVTTRQVLVQKKPDGWEKMWSGAVDMKLLRDQTDLIGKEVVVRKSSSFVQRLKHLSDEIGGDIIIKEDSTGAETEDLIKKVALGEIKYTVADEEVALVNAAYYPSLDVKTPISFPQQIAWAVRKNANNLLQSIDEWMVEIQASSFHQVIYNKYFRVDRSLVERAMSEYSSVSGTSLSEYDPLLKQYADSIQWDWLLLASMVYQESRFNADAQSWAGASGLMQLMPVTGSRFGAKNLLDPEQNIRAGTRYLSYLEEQWKETVSDSTERVKFILASYNIGSG